MPWPALSEEIKAETIKRWEEHGRDATAAAKSYDPPMAVSTFTDRLRRARGTHRRKSQRAALHSRRHFFVPDTQVRPGVPLDHLDWVRKAIEEYKPDVLVVGGDWWDFPSLNSHEEPGSEFMEGRRYYDDVDSGNVAYKRTFDGLKHKPARRVFLGGNHEDRPDKFSSLYPKFRHMITSQDCDTLDFERYKFGDIVEIDGILYSHYFSNPHSGRAIGGTPQNRLNKVAQSFTQGHVQGLEYGCKLTPTGHTHHGLVAGSCYLHLENYRGVHQKHWRGVVIKNEVRDGDYCIMPLTLDYLCRKYERKPLYDYMKAKYPDQNWEHLK